MADFQASNLIYLLILLCVIGYWTLRDYRGNWQKGLRHALMWIAIICGLFLIVRLAGY